jgi:hypothetical protein
VTPAQIIATEPTIETFEEAMRNEADDTIALIEGQLGLRDE